ncbi:hypothetical protein G6709_03840 [Polynucleobacter paneuropaeus]|nr:hypothetical protein [Polynucleobacter paneuropaeus]
MATLPKAQRKIRSGGPKTAEGKLASSRNAIKTGAYAVQALLPGESEYEFRELEQLFIDDFVPAGISEAALVHSLTVIVWKKLRLEKLESRHIHNLLDQFPKSYELSAIGFDDYPSAAQEWVNHPELISSLDLNQAQGGYWALAALKKCCFDLDEMQSFKKESPVIFKRLQDLLSSLGVKDLSISSMVGTRYHHGAETRPIEDTADKLMGQLQGEIWAIQNQERLLKVRQQIRDKRLVEYLNLNRSQRVADDLDRSYFKTLEELRRQIEWRKKQEVIDIPVKLASKNIKH